MVGQNLRNLGNAGAWFSKLAAEAMKTLEEIRERETAEDLDALIENFDKLVTEARELLAMVKLGGVNISIADPGPLEGDENDGIDKSG